jgi:hypothetical protein
MHFGQLTCLNLCLWASCSHSFITDPGASSELPLWWKWAGNCAKCAWRVTSLQGIFCANYSSSRGGWPECRQAWHPECYTCQGTHIFPMSVLLDDDGELWEGQEDRAARLNTGIAGIHVSQPFQCEICWIRNLEGRDPVPVEDRDRLYLTCLRRANLDAINSRAKGTIKHHVDFIETTLRNCKTINRTPKFQPRGPFPLDDLVGMGPAVDLLMKSITSKGRITKHIQYNTTRKGRSTYSKIWESSPAGIMEGSTFTMSTARVRITSCNTQT